ncbi:MAG: Maf family nucleotide pyrophosphatase [Saprospiraceae bacterium]
MINRPIILASQSPRRHQLLKEAGFEFEVKTRSIDESFPESMPAKDVAEYLAIEKAKAVADWITNEEIIITADSVVILNNKIYGKPVDAADAFRIIRELSGNIHQVITGVCISGKEKQVAFSEVANVHFEEISDNEINYYIKNYQPFDKAGAYGVQEWLGFTKVKKIEGTFANIMGLPVHRVYQELMNF